VCSQLAQEVVNASLRTPLHRPDDADVKLSGHFLRSFAPLHEPPSVPRVFERVTLVAKTRTVRFLLGVVSKFCALARSPTVSHYCGDVSGARQTVRLPGA